MGLGGLSGLGGIVQRAGRTVPGTPIAAYGATQIISTFDGNPATNIAGIWSWADQTGNGYGLTAERATDITFSAEAGFTLSGNNSLRRAALSLSSNYSLYVLATVTPPTKGSLFLNGRVASLPNTGLSFGFGGATHDSAGNNYRALVQTIVWGTGALTVPTGQSLFRGYSKSNGQSRIGINNGASLVSSSTAPNAVTDGLLLIGGHVAHDGSIRYFTGVIKSVLLYDYDTEFAGEDAAICSFVLGL